MTTKPEPVEFSIGERVKAHPACDCFMQGDIYGVVRKVTHRRRAAIIHVAMERSGKMRKFVQDLLLHT